MHCSVIITGDIAKMQTVGAMKEKFVRMVKAVDLLSLPVSGMLVLALLYVSLPLVAFVGFDIGMLKAHASRLTAQSVLYSVIGIICFMWGAFWRGTMLNRGGGTSSIIFAEWNNLPRVLFVCVTLFVAGFGSKIVHVLTGDYLLHKYLGPMGGPFVMKYFISLNIFHTLALAVACCFYYRLRQINDPGACLWRKIAFGLLMFEIVCGLLTRGSRLAVVIPIAIALLSRHYLCQRNNRLALIVGFVVVALLFPIKNLLRNPAEPINNYLTADRGHGVLVVPYGGMDALDILYYGIDEFLGREGASDRAREFVSMPSAVVSFVSDSSMGRLGQAQVFAIIVERTNSYLYGRTFLSVFSHLGLPGDFVERVSGIGAEHDYAVRSGLVAMNKEGVPAAKVPPTVMGDLYLNFGLVGIIAGMFVIGCFAKQLHRCLVEENARCPTVFIYAMLWIFALHGLEEPLAEAVAKLFKTSAFTMVVCAAISVPIRKSSV